MWRLIKGVFFLAVLGGIGMVGFAYLGPALGSDFSAPQTEVRQPVTLGDDAR
jgi:hypothetical protein